MSKNEIIEALGAAILETETRSQFTFAVIDDRVVALYDMDLETGNFNGQIDLAEAINLNPNF